MLMIYTIPRSILKPTELVQTLTRGLMNYLLWASVTGIALKKQLSTIFQRSKK